MKPYVIRGTAKKDGCVYCLNYGVEDMQFLDGAKDSCARVLFNRMCERDGYEPIEYMEAEAV